MTTYTCTTGMNKGTQFINIDSDNTMKQMILLNELLDSIHTDYKHQPKLIKLVVESGVSPNFIVRNTSKDGVVYEDTPLTMSLQDWPRLDVIQMLIACGADPSIKVTSGGLPWDVFTALEHAQDCDSKGIVNEEKIKIKEYLMSKM